MSDQPLWTLFEEGTSATSLEKLFGYQVSLARDSRNASLFEMLYSPEQRQIRLDQGFHGQPSIAAAVFASMKPKSAGTAWRSLLNAVQEDIVSRSSARVFLFGSLFGGTGSAVLAQLPKMLRAGLEQKEDRLIIGAAALLPYFLISPSDSVHSLIPTERFSRSAKDSLEYLSLQSAEYNRVYVLGDGLTGPLAKFSPGGEAQSNPAHIVELFAARQLLNFQTPQSSANGNLWLLPGKTPN